MAGGRQPSMQTFYKRLYRDVLYVSIRPKAKPRLNNSDCHLDFVRELASSRGGRPGGEECQG
jgi:hypothetical protein